MKLESINEPAHSLRIIRRRRMCLTNGKVKRSKHIAIERSTSSARTTQQQPHAAQPASIAFHASKTCAISPDRMRHSLRRSDQGGAGVLRCCGVRRSDHGVPIFPKAPEGGWIPSAWYTSSKNSGVVVFPVTFDAEA